MTPNNRVASKNTIEPNATHNKTIPNAPVALADGRSSLAEVNDRV